MDDARHPDAPSALPMVSGETHEALIRFLYRAPIGLVQMSLDGSIEMMNPKAAQLLMPMAVAGQLDNLFDVFETTAPELRTLAAAYPHAAGSIVDALRVPVGDDAGPPRVLTIDLAKLDAGSLMAVIGDATADAEREQREIARQLCHAARIDTLTSMPNRTALLERVRAALLREPIDAGYEFAVLHLNCDRFKQINDSFGHAAGDEVLALMAGRMRATLRPGDSVGRAGAPEQMAARISGDEFVVLLEHLGHPGDVHGVVARLLEALARPYHVDGHALHCGVSIGIVARAHAVDDADALLQDASIAMDEAKRAGGARYAVFEPAMRSQAALRGGVEEGLRQALDEDQLFVVYQPVITLQSTDGTTGDLGVEALVRWRHPTRGVMPPIEFIGVAETTGLIGPLGAYVLTAACRQFVAWERALGADAPRLLAVNVSRAQLGAQSFVASVATTLRTTGMAPARLQLEITESLAAQDASVQARLHELKALGVTLALDDFGTGYSSLSSLHLLPVDTVKIDRSFVGLVDTSPHHRVLVEATIRVARSLGMGTVAEGIETATQAAVIRTLGCDKGQGYLFGRPMTAEAIEAWLAGRQAVAIVAAD